MKKLISIIFAVLLVFSLGACNSDNTDNTNPSVTTQQGTTAEPTYEIDWTIVPDKALVGAWKSVDEDKDEYILFTDDAKIRAVMGTHVFDADINYGVDGYGNKSAYTEGLYLYGQWVYTIEGDTLTVTYPTSKTYQFKAVDYTPITLEAKDDFVKNDALVGKWINKQFQDSYEFTEDGYAIYNQSIDNGVNVYDIEVKQTYTVTDNTITLYFYDNNNGEENSGVSEYQIDGTKIMIGDLDYYLNGEGSPEPTTATEAE